jgi:hypothetical protein
MEFPDQLPLLFQPAPLMGSAWRHSSASAVGASVAQIFNLLVSPEIVAGRDDLERGSAALWSIEWLRLRASFIFRPGFEPWDYEHLDLRR